MFINNKYKTWHDNIITKAKNRTLIGYKLGRDKTYLTKEYSLNMSKLTQAYWDRRSA